MESNYTKEQIARAIAPYVVSVVVIHTEEGWKQPLTYSSVDLVDLGASSIGVGKWKLLLRSVSELTDKELESIAKVCGINSDYYKILKHDGERVVVGLYECDREEDEKCDEGDLIEDCSDNDHAVFFYIDNNGWNLHPGKERDEYRPMFNSEVYGQVSEYMRSIGVDLPSFHLGGKTLFEAGLATYSKEGGE